MRKTSVALIVAVGLLAFFHSSVAQTFVTIQGQIAEPTGSFRNAAGTGYGVGTSYIRHVSSHLALTGSAGYLRWQTKSAVPGIDQQFSAVPVAFGAQYLLSRGVFAPFIGVSVGMHFLRSKVNVITPTVGVSNSESTDTKFAVSPYVGWALHVAGPVGVTMSATYNVVFTGSVKTKYFGFGGGLAVGF